MPCTSTSAPPKKKARVDTDTVDDSEYTENLKKLDAEFKKEMPSRPLINTRTHEALSQWKAQVDPG